MYETPHYYAIIFDSKINLCWIVLSRRVIIIECTDIDHSRLHNPHTIYDKTNESQRVVSADCLLHFFVPSLVHVLREANEQASERVNE